MEPMVPVPDELTAFFWTGAAQGKLLIQRCDRCGFYVHWPRPCCKRCNSFELTPAEVSGADAVLVHHLRASVRPLARDAHPDVLAVVELEKQHNLKLVTNIVECAEEDLRCGMPVEVTFEKITDQVTLPVFRPRARVPNELIGGIR